MRQTQEITLYDAVTPVAITSSTDATPIVITATAHGFSTGDRVLIQGHATNIAANGIFKVTRVSSSTFSLQNEFSGADIAGSGAGAGSNTGICLKAPSIALIEDFLYGVLEFHTSGSANFTGKVAGSLGKPLSTAAKMSQNLPNFGVTQSVADPYTFFQSINLDDGSTVNGSTGITTAGTDIHKAYEVNVNASKYLTLLITNWSAGAITVKLQLFNNK